MEMDSRNRPSPAPAGVETGGTGEGIEHWYVVPTVPRNGGGAIRITFSSSLAIESVRASQQFPLEKSVACALKTDPTTTGITVRLELILNSILYKVDEYPGLRAFYNRVEAKIWNQWC